MMSTLDLKAYALKTAFNLSGRMGSPLLNLGFRRDLEVLTDLPYGAEKDHRLDILRPKSRGPDGLPILVFFHGGGWISADKSIYNGIAATFSRNGFLTFNVNYRLAPKDRFPAPLQDAATAINWIYENASNYGGNRSVMVLAGDSAGAQIVSWYTSALHRDHLFQEIGTRSLVRKASVKGLLLFYGVFDFDTVLDTRLPFIRVYARSFLGGEPGIYAPRSALASPIRQVSRHLPPVWLCAGERDGLFSQSEAYAETLRSHGVPCRTLFFPRQCRANHGFLFFRWLGSSKAALASAFEFLREMAKVDCQR